MEQVDIEIIYTIVEDSKVLRNIWSKVDELWQPFEQEKLTSFNLLNPTKFAKSLDKINNNIGNLPPELKSHDIIQGKRKELSKIKKEFRLIRDLKSEAIKEHHFKEILKIINLKKEPEDIILGDFFKIGVMKFEKPINEIVSHATGELVLENLITKIKEFWTNEEFETSNYQNKV